jgi:acetyl-CoA synthetase
MSIDSVPTHPVPPRMTDGSEVPFIGPNLEAYKKAHAETVGENADKWWAKVFWHLLFLQL